MMNVDELSTEADNFFKGPPVRQPPIRQPPQSSYSTFLLKIPNNQYLMAFKGSVKNLNIGTLDKKPITISGSGFIGELDVSDRKEQYRANQAANVAINLGLKLQKQGVSLPTARFRKPDIVITGKGNAISGDIVVTGKGNVVSLPESRQYTMGSSGSSSNWLSM